MAEETLEQEPGQVPGVEVPAGPEVPGTPAVENDESVSEESGDEPDDT